MATRRGIAGEWMVSGLGVGLLVVVLATLLIAVAGRLLQKGLRLRRGDRQRRPTLWNRVYALGGGGTTTANPGFAPADPDDKGPERFQRQMYRELLKLLRDKRPDLPFPARLVDVGCGRGGGLRAFLDAAGPDAFRATGLDIAASAIAYCQRSSQGRGEIDFVEGDAMDLPFATGSIDILLNVEASNDYPDRSRFFAEVRRVLRPGGVFLYADRVMADGAGPLAAELQAAGFRFELRDITANVADACRLDGITDHRPMLGGEQRYLMTAAKPA